MPFIAAARPSPGSAALTGPCAPSAVTACRPAKPLAPITRCTRTSLFRPVPDLPFRVASEWQGEAGLPLLTPSVLAQTVATFPPVVGDGQRRAAPTGAGFRAGDAGVALEGFAAAIARWACPLQHD